MLGLKAFEVKKLIATGLNEKLSNEGFGYRKSNNEFFNRNAEYLNVYNIEQLSWTNSISIDVHLRITQFNIELILEKIIGKTNHKITLGQEIGRLYASPDGRQVTNGTMVIWLRSDQDVDAATESLEWNFFNIAKPYFEKYNNLKAIDDIMNNPPFEHCPAAVGGNFDDRCMKGLIVARLVGNPEYENLVRIYDDEIKGTMNSGSIENYYKVREYLMYNRISL